jgi:hypothetical protein
MRKIDFSFKKTSYGIISFDYSMNTAILVTPATRKYIMQLHHIQSSDVPSSLPCSITSFTQGYLNYYFLFFFSFW